MLVNGTSWVAAQSDALKEAFAILGRLTGVKAPKVKLPRELVLTLAHVNKWRC